MVISLIVHASLGLLTYPLSFPKRYRILTAWADFVIWWLAKSCKLYHRVHGLEHLPDRPSIVMSNHQSTWETFALKRLFPPASYVVKRELLWVPFFGWAFALLEPIALNRGAGHQAVVQLLAQGKQRLAAGRWIIMFPEGTRVRPGQNKPYKMGGAVVASETQAPVIPVAHNAGYFWSRRQLLKRPGTITVRIGPPIDTAGKSPEQIIKEVKTWIDNAREEIGTANGRRLGT